ncbi:MAG: tetraacyldisaccharide 4'-kinase [Marinobacter sp.]|uniref:tetraacyldisaccharide 4'-kinase n=1 Tax=Marinobacter sp. TaxID=50741 RepID=UPI00299E780F|nr:tetraacyldisaccharide 4'-kinase [Marinobacter sp.]MDX1633040.1 tetraacyldisaccharide 4'-kinase [Marinobacter sp.]
MSGWLDRLWYGRQRPLWFLWPLASLYRAIARRRRQKALADLAEQPPLTAPVIVVGNITAGGTGKSPLTAWLVSRLAEQGWRPVIITRGYGGKARHYPLRVTEGTDPAEAGDEPVMLARQCGCPVVVDPRRARAARWALEQDLGNVLVCDDGLQHYALARHLEIAVFDGQRGLGNGAPIPVGPLREGPERLDSVDFVVCNGRVPPGLEHPRTHVMQLSPTQLRHLRSGETRPVDWLMGKPVRAVAGIGNPARFFETLNGLGASVRPLALPDHHRFSRRDLAVGPGEILVMTAKDAVKCQGLAHEHCWVLEVTARLPESFRQALLHRLNRIHLNQA